MTKNSNDYRAPSTSSDRALTKLADITFDGNPLTPAEHAARAMLLAGHVDGNLWYDKHTNAYRPRSPAEHAYKYSGCYDADTLEPLPKGEALRRELTAGVRNTVSNLRLGIDGG